MATNAERLASVQSRIAAIESGAQSASNGPRSQTNADLKTLYDREDHLLLLVARESTGGVSGRTIVPAD